MCNLEVRAKDAKAKDGRCIVSLLRIAVPCIVWAGSLSPVSEGQTKAQETAWPPKVRAKAEDGRCLVLLVAHGRFTASFGLALQALCRRGRKTHKKRHGPKNLASGVTRAWKEPRPPVWSRKGGSGPEEGVRQTRRLSLQPRML